MISRKFLLPLLFLLIINGLTPLSAQSLPEEVKESIEKYLTAQVQKQTFVRQVTIDSVHIGKKKLQLFAAVSLSYRTYRQHEINELYTVLKKFLPENLQKYQLEIYSDGYKIEEYVPFSRKERIQQKVDKPLLTNLSDPVRPVKGLQNRHIALWQSHGWYYEQKLARWEWQRARLFGTVEDLYTQSYVLPYLVPMLEKAGANVFLPRERDIQPHEVIVDNDKSTGQSEYKELAGKEQWHNGNTTGFAHLKDWYVDGENPFKTGSFRQVRSVTKGDESYCEWIPDIPEKGEYAVYISYHTLPNSSDDARYTVWHAGGKTAFSVNQQMGGGTWIYLGHFRFDKGKNETAKVVLSNQSRRNGKIITADAVKIGGGVGNIARLPLQQVESPERTSLVSIDYEPETSSYPRYAEAARYWLQWAGAPDSVYNRSESSNDYTDDYQSRGLWVNYLAGGSSVLPRRNGLSVPLDLSLAFHTDAGTTYTDSIVGTLGICMTHTNDETFENGKARIASRHLTDYIMTEIVSGIRRDYEPEWTQRAIWNRSYSEARLPEVPSMLLELLSHQNLADMRYGLDPRFRFSVSRSIYKGILKYLAHQCGYEYVVQPLPVKAFSLRFAGESEVELQWEKVDDPVEPTASPHSYRIYTRIGEGGFDNGFLTKQTSIRIPISKGQIYSFRIAAVNNGGESFPSEILSVCRLPEEKGTVLVVNGFTRLSAPHSFVTTDSLGGFVDFIDHGVPDGVEYHYTGSQYEFRRAVPWMDDDAPGFGASQANYETTPIAGNTFDYPFIHGQAIVANGYSFISAGQESVCNGRVSLEDYPVVDLILGKQKRTRIGRGIFPEQYEIFPDPLQEKITNYCLNGGSIFISGAYVASDLWDNGIPSEESQRFATDVLKYKWRVDRAAVEGKVKSVPSPYSLYKGSFTYCNTLNPDCYAVESPDAIEPADPVAHTIFRYSENNLSAGVAYKREYKTCVLGFPFETIREPSVRVRFMKELLDFFSE